jgi:glycosyltransferase involved in cell wall biosynthesis
MVKKRGISVIIPAYNAADWLEPTFEHILNALDRATYSKNESEVVIVDDGSKDTTKQVASSIAGKSNIPVRIVEQENQGRFLARKRGVEISKYEDILFVDTRVWIDEGSLAFVLGQRGKYPDRKVWNGHVNVHKKGNIIARFGDAITCIGWRRYFSHPRLTSYGLEDFDYYPKGTGFFLAPRETLMDAIEWFEQQTKDVRNSSDDTLLIRHIAESQRIWLSPDFSCTYFARTTLRGFVKHSYYRGQFFVDGFLRRGTRFFYPLLLFLALCVALVVFCIFMPYVILILALLLAVLWFFEFVVALLLGIGLNDAFSLFALSPLFACTYGLGIWRAVLRRITI